MPLASLIDVTKAYGRGGRRKVVLEGVTAHLPPLRAIALMGSNGAGKSTLMRLLAGSELPDRGRVERGGRISWPLGLASGFNGSMTGRENALFVARLYAADPDYVLDYVAWFSELGASLGMPISTYSSGMKARFAFGLSLAIDFDTFLIDEITAVGDARFRRKCRVALVERIGPPEARKAGVVMISHSVGTIAEWCDCGYLLHEGALTYHENVETLLKAYRRLP